MQGFAEFVEEARVLNGDNRLIGEGLDKFDLLARERSNFCPIPRQEWVPASARRA